MSGKKQTMSAVAELVCRMELPIDPVIAEDGNIHEREACNVGTLEIHGIRCPTEKM